MKKNEKKQSDEYADLRFRHFELARKVSLNMLKEMENEKLTARDVPQVLSDVCKFVVLSMAEVNKGDALDVVSEFVDLVSDVTLLMMRITTDNYGKGLESLKEETDEPRS